MPSSDDQATVGFTVPPGLSAVCARYDLIAEIGRGGMGIVYKARDRHTGDLVALKALHPSIAADPRLVERFTNELLLARRITHKNVCRVYDLNDFAGTTVITMELVDGRSLRTLMRDVEAVSIRQGLRIARQIAAGLAEAHAQGIVHRDLKPENILIARDGVVKVMDFGIARLMDSRLTATGQLLGTPAYMSPEQAQGRPADARSDIYSLGLVMYELFCGQPAFSGETPVALVAKQAAETPIPPRTIEADLPPRIDAAIRRCLEKDPGARFQSIAELDAALAGGSTAALDTPAPAPASASLPERLTTWRRADWLLLAGAVVGAIVFVLAFGRVSLAPRSQVAFDRPVLGRIAEEHLQRLGLRPANLRITAGNLDPGAYVYLARTYGAATARQLANDPVHYWTWAAAFDGGSLEMDNSGRLVAFSRREVPIEAGGRRLDDARRLAAGTVAELFAQPQSALQLDHETTGRVYGFAWLGTEIAPGLRQRYAVDVDQIGVASLRASPAIPPGYSIDSFPFGEVTMNEWGLPIAVVLGIAASIVGFLNRRRVARDAGWRTALLLVGFAVGAGQSLASMRFFGPGEQLAVPIGFGMLLAAAAYLGSIAVEALSTRADLPKLETIAALFAPRRDKSAAGLAVMRGCAIGLALLAIDTAALWIATTQFGGRLSMIHIGLLGVILNTSAWPTGVVWGVCLVQLVGVGLLVALAHTVAARAPLPAWAADLGAAALLAASGIRLSMATVAPWPLTAIVLFIDYALLLALIRRFDLLTLYAAIGTFGLWWANYALWVMQRPIGATGAWLTFVLWGLGAACAAAAAQHWSLRRGWQRLAAAFD